MSMEGRTLGKGEAYAKISFVSCVWGLSFVASKYAMQQGFGEFTLAFVRYVFVCLVMVPLMRVKDGEWRLPKRQDVPAVILSGIAGISLYFVLEYMGVMRTTVANASLVLAAIPVFSILWGAIRGRKYRPAVWLGVGVSMIGVFCVAYFGAVQESGGFDTAVLIGNLLLLGAGICWVVYIEMSDRLLKRYTSLDLTVWQGVAGLITLLPVALLESPSWQPVPISGWLAVLFLALICSALAFFWYAQAIRALSPIQAAIFINLNPIIAVVAGVLLLSEPVTTMQIVGGVMIVGSILLVNAGMSRKSGAV